MEEDWGGDKMRIYYDKLFKLMEDRGISNTMLTAEAGIPLTIISDMHHGYNIDNQYLYKMMDYFECTWDCIIDYDADEEPLKPTETKSRHRARILQYTKEGKYMRMYKSAREAGRILNKEFSAINKCCNGERKTAYGFKWKWEDEEFKLTI